MIGAARFSKIAPNRTFVSIVLGAAAGLSYALLIPMVLSAVRPDNGRLDQVPTDSFLVAGIEIARPPLAITFACSCLFILVARTISHLLLNNAASDISRSLRQRLYDRVLAAPLSAIEKIGARRLDSALATDIPRMVLGARLLPELLVSGVTLIGMLGFLVIRNSDVFWFVIASVAFGGLTYQIPMIFSQRHFVRARLAQDDLHQSFASIIRGFKELKLDPNSCAEYMGKTVESHDQSMTRSEKLGTSITTLATNYGDLINFFVIGFVIFIFINYFSISRDDLVGVVMVLLYVTSPVAIILRAIPPLAISRVSGRRFQDLLDDLPDEVVDPVQRPLEPWEEIRLEEICFRYEKSSRDLAVGPVSLSIRKGMVTFIVGGNGSGKSTLGKVMALHYPASSGRISFGAVPIGPDSLVTYRKTISAIHSDYHIFAHPLGALDPPRQARIESYLQKFGLGAVVRIVDGRFSTTDLSDGQRRRLALVQALADDREFYLFDEWAADQDPEFKKIFYDEILPDLRSRGKAVVAITHDDRYFDRADRVIVMEDGRITNDSVSD